MFYIILDCSLILWVIIGPPEGAKIARVHLLETPCTSSPDYWVGLEERRQEDEREENGVGFAWRRDEEEEGGGGEENGEDYDDCYCEDCVVGGTHFKIDQIS